MALLNIIREKFGASEIWTVEDQGNKLILKRNDFEDYRIHVEEIPQDETGDPPSVKVYSTFRDTLAFLSDWADSSLEAAGAIYRHIAAIETQLLYEEIESAMPTLDEMNPSIFFRTYERGE